MPHPVTDLSAFLKGAWRLERRILDRRTGARGRLTGEAVFREEGGGLAYRESGTLELDGGAFETHRAYRYHFPVPGRAEVAFDDGRPFHALDLTTGAWVASHDCAPDLYRGRFRVPVPDLWLAFWRIAGPRKDQVLATRYRRR